MIKQSPLAHLYPQNKNPKAEYETIKNKVGMIDYSLRGKIKVTGDDRVTFLNNMLTNDIKTMSADDFCQAAFLSSTAKVLAYFDVFLFSDYILLDIEPGYEKKAVEQLDKFIITEDVHLEIVTNQYLHIALEGQQSSEGLKLFCEIPESTHFKVQTWEGISFFIYPKSTTGEVGFHLVLDSKSGMGLVEEILKNRIPFIGPTAQNILRIEAGILQYGKDFNEETVLNETGLEKNAVSETKGCYPGQEVVAKIITYDGLHRFFSKIVLEGNELPKEGSSILFDTKPIGVTTSTCYSYASQCPIALGLVKKAIIKDSQNIQILSGSQILEGQLNVL